MSVSRRGFLGAMLGAMAAPAIVRSESLMKIFVPPEKKIVLQPLYRDLKHLPIMTTYDTQDAFGEVFWPTVVLDPTMVGLQPSCNYELNKAGILVRRYHEFQ